MAATKKKQVKADPIQVWRITARRESYDLIPFEWPKLLIESNPSLILRPMPNAVLPKPISVEVLGPSSEIRALKKSIADRFVFENVSTDKTEP